MRKGNPAWKVALAALSLLLSIFVWTKGLQESFERPSVNPQISLHQREVSVLAEPVFPELLKSSLIGVDPRDALRNALREISLNEISERNRILLASLETSLKNKNSLLDHSFEKDYLKSIKTLLLNPSNQGLNKLNEFKEINDIKNDPILYNLTCLNLADNQKSCIDYSLAKAMANRLILSQLLPLFAVFTGSILLIRQIWILLRGKNLEWPPVLSMPLSIVDMVILIAGGFVVLGEVLLPAIIMPLGVAFTKGLEQPVSDSLRVLIGYSAMTFPPLFILRQQINGFGNIDRPVDGWFQWKLRPIDGAIFKAVNGWLMIMPLVLVVGWAMNSLFGDQGGSNPLLELVLNSQNTFALGLLVFTTVVMAPLFEELIFRGVLLPVLANRIGSLWGIIVSGFIFAIAHISVSEFPPLFVLGIGLGIMRISSGRLFPSILMHSIWNGVTFLSLLLLGG